MENKIFTVQQIDESCWQIKEKGEFTLGVNCFLVSGKNLAVLVDSGFGQRNIREVAEGLTNLPIKLVLTHGDSDHARGYKHFDVAHMHPSEFARYHAVIGKDAQVSPLWDGDVIDLGGRRLEVKLTPGHTQGSIVLLDLENRVLFGGDSVQDGMIIMDCYDTLHLLAGRDLAAYIASLKKLKKMQDRFDNVYAAHGSAVVGRNVIDELLVLAEKVLNGELEGTKAPSGVLAERDAKVYTFGSAMMFH
jgi:glyoxylase-like metal-dependent hydrolase (beta-lactamase superfamily II)